MIMADINWLKDIVKVYKFHITIDYSPVSNWVVYVMRKGCAYDGSDLVIFDGEDSDLSLLLAKAEVAVKEYCSENLGGY